ncbi:hypothetical protein [Sulfurimonas sp. HSL-1716]|uniref:hypothetical protein n=1 Tax=Hydrocurvibacter sulfurireducens TaxID=3131937 RepID=UPI0031F89C50
MDSLQDTTVIREHIPLISNLNIVENIAIIQEVHAYKQVIKAEAEALELLRIIALEEIAQKRASQCSEFEIFCAMLLRALMNDNERIVIVTPFSFITSLTSIKEIAEVIYKLDIKKDIIIADMKNNQTNYEGDLCHIAE